MRPTWLPSLLLPLVILACLPIANSGVNAQDDAALQKAVIFYASFDDEVKADKGGGDKTVYTGVRPEPGKPKPAPQKGFDAKVFTIAKSKGIAGGCLEAVDVLPNNGRIYFPAKGNIAYQKGGWGGAMSMWINFDPDKMLKTTFCDPVQITHKGAHNGAIWFDFNNAKPRDMRHGAFPALKEGEKALAEDDARAPMVRMPKVGFQQGDWHHILINWKNFDTGKADAVSQFWVDGKLIGEVKDRAIGVEWDIDQVGIFTAINYIGLLDEFALFDRPLTEAEIQVLRKQPGVLQPLKKAAAPALKDAEVAKLLEKRPAGDPPAAPKFPFDAAAAQRYQEDYAKWLGVPVEFTSEQGIAFRLVPPGKFRIGSPADEPGHNSGGFDETPTEVTLTRPFFLSKYETTVGQFRRFVEEAQYVTDVEKSGGGNAHDAKAEWKHRAGTQWRKPGYAAPFELREDHPIVHVSWTDSKNYCQWLNQAIGRDPKGSVLRYDLPTEAQWEWACRAGAGTRYWWGAAEDATGQVANVGDKSLKKVHPDWPRPIMPMDDGHAFCAPVGSYRPNAFGLHDMLGNVWEFCSTNYGPYAKEPVADPGSLDLKRGLAVRGGGWSNPPADVRCASRNSDPPHFGHSNLGFRVALLLPAQR